MWLGVECSTTSGCEDRTFTLLLLLQNTSSSPSGCFVLQRSCFVSFCTRAHTASFHLASSQPWLPLSECSLCVHLARVCVRRRMMRNSTLCVHLKCVPSSSCCSCCSCCSHTVAAARARLCACVCVCAPLPPPPLPAAASCCCCCPRREEKRNPHEEKNVCNAHTHETTSPEHNALFFRDESKKSKNKLLVLTSTNNPMEFLCRNYIR